MFRFQSIALTLSPPLCGEVLGHVLGRGILPASQDLVPETLGHLGPGPRRHCASRSGAVLTHTLRAG